MHTVIMKVFIYLMPLWLFALLMVLFHTLHPVESGPWGIMLVFLVVYGMTASTLFTILHLGYGQLRRYQGKKSSAGYSRAGINARKAYYIASIVAFGPVMLLALQSVRQLDATDVILVTVFITLACFYVLKKQY